MQITVNGEKRRYEQAPTLPRILDDLHLGQRRIAVELNGEILPRSRHAGTTLADGDELLIVHAIGGG